VAVIAAALASQGKKVFCTLPEPHQRFDRLQGMAGETLFLAPDDSEKTLDGAIRIEGLPPVSAELNLGASATRSRALVCVVSAGRVTERDVRNFQSRTLEAGMSSLSFVLLEE
jgi:hypothetical protein